MSVAETEDERTQETLLKFMAAKRLTYLPEHADPIQSHRDRFDLWIRERETLDNLLETRKISKRFREKWFEEVLGPALDLLLQESVNLDEDKMRAEGYVEDPNGDYDVDQWRREKFPEVWSHVNNRKNNDAPSTAASALWGALQGHYGERGSE